MRLNIAFAFFVPLSVEVQQVHAVKQVSEFLDKPWNHLIKTERARNTWIAAGRHLDSQFPAKVN